MDRFQVRQDLENRSFELRASTAVPLNQRYVVDRKHEYGKERTTYQILGSGGARAIVWTAQVMTSQPFVITRIISDYPTEHVYKAIEVAELDNLSEVF